MRIPKKTRKNPRLRLPCLIYLDDDGEEGEEEVVADFGPGMTTPNEETEEA